MAERRLAEIYRENAAAKRPTVSFELYPPKNAEDEKTLFDVVVPQLAELRPAFMTVTYGAGGSGRDRTLELTERLRAATGIDVASHLACLDSTPEFLNGYLARSKKAGIVNIVAIRGDKPQGQAEWKPAPGTLLYALDLVKLVRAAGDFGIAVSGYPEGHPECREGREADWRRTIEKVQAGGDIVITQLFFENRDFVEFDAFLRREGVTAPIVPGVLPILATGQIKRFTARCGASLPAPLLQKLEGFGDDAAGVSKFGIEYAVAQCRDLLAHGVAGLHFYTLNRAHATGEVLKGLGLR